MDDTKKPAIDVSELQYYFDAQERDTLDRLGHSRRSTEVLTIRDRLLALPQRDFESVVATIKNLLTSPAQDGAKTEEAQRKRKDAGELYDMARSDKATGSMKVNSV
jgi:hypothetical protein